MKERVEQEQEGSMVGKSPRKHTIQNHVANAIPIPTRLDMHKLRSTKTAWVSPKDSKEEKRILGQRFSLEELIALDFDVIEWDGK